MIATGFIPLSTLFVVSTMVIWESSQWLGENIVWIYIIYMILYWLKELQESLIRYTGRRDIPEVLFKTALNTVYNHSVIVNVENMEKQD